MTDIEKSILTAVLTIFGGVIVYVVGQLLSKFFIEPLHDLRKAIGEVRFNLAFHAATIHTPEGRSMDSSDEARVALSKNSCVLLANLHAIPFYGVTRLLAFGVLPGRAAIERAAVQLRGLSTYVHETGERADASIDIIRKRVTLIEKLLSLKPLE